MRTEVRLALVTLITSIGINSGNDISFTKNIWRTKFWSVVPHGIRNKKVLLRERKRHTARRVVSTHSVVLSWLTPPPPPHWLTWPSCGWLTPPADPPSWPTSPGWHPPPPGWTDPPLWLTPTPPADWPPPAESADWPPPPCGQTDRHVSKHNLPVVLRTRAVIMNFTERAFRQFRINVLEASQTEMEL